MSRVRYYFDTKEQVEAFRLGIHAASGLSMPLRTEVDPTNPAVVVVEFLDDRDSSDVKYESVDPQRATIKWVRGEPRLVVGVQALRLILEAYFEDEPFDLEDLMNHLIEISRQNPTTDPTAADASEKKGDAGCQPKTKSEDWSKS